MTVRVATDLSRGARGDALAQRYLPSTAITVLTGVRNTRGRAIGILRAPSAVAIGTAIRSTTSTCIAACDAVVTATTRTLAIVADWKSSRQARGIPSYGSIVVRAYLGALVDRSGEVADRLGRLTVGRVGTSAGTTQMLDCVADRSRGQDATVGVRVAASRFRIGIMIGCINIERFR